MLRRFLSWLIWLPIAVIIIIFVVANRQGVVLALLPGAQADSGFAMTIPLWAVFALGLLIGLIIGGFYSAMRQLQQAKRLRAIRKELDLVRGQLQQATSHVQATDEQAAKFFPLIGKH